MIKVKALRDFGSQDYGYLRTGDVVRMTDIDASNLRSYGYVEFYEIEDHEELSLNHEINSAIATVTKTTRTPKKATA